MALFDCRQDGGPLQPAHTAILLGRRQSLMLFFLFAGRDTRNRHGCTNGVTGAGLSLGAFGYGILRSRLREPSKASGNFKLRHYLHCHFRRRTDLPGAGVWGGGAGFRVKAGPGRGPGAGMVPGGQGTGDLRDHKQAAAPGG